MGKSSFEESKQQYISSDEYQGDKTDLICAKKYLVIGKLKKDRALSDHQLCSLLCQKGQSYQYRAPTECGKQIPKPFYLGLSNTARHKKFRVDENTGKFILKI